MVKIFELIGDFKMNQEIIGRKQKLSRCIVGGELIYQVFTDICKLSSECIRLTSVK